MKIKILSVLAVVMSLIGGANVALAQTTRDQGVVTGSQANSGEHSYGGYSTSRP
jgi:hypothetical protein